MSLEKLRKLLGKTQEQFAADLGFKSQAAYSKAERDGVSIKFETLAELIKIWRAAGHSDSDLLDELARGR